ncbi:MAG: GNAT family N-acetyltransferase [Deltaproteobacteria bacterium]|nr:GNAT family N-acetyltransferase [Deltaproteobacteria bacterium]
MIVGKRVLLRAMERGDLPRVQRWMNDPEVLRRIYTYRHLSLDAEERWLQQMGESSSDFVFAIDTHDGTGAAIHIGTTGIHHVDWKNRTCMVGIVLGEARHRGQGLGTEAMHLVVRYAHQELGLHRVELEVYPFNQPAIRSYEKLGFRLDGTRRAATFREGKFQDVLVMSVLPGELLSA